MPWESRPGTNRLYIIQKKRVGGQVYSAYYGSGEAPEAIARVENSLTMVRQWDRYTANLVSHDLISSSAANEVKYSEVESRLIEALTAAGFHRQNRGPWRKVRTANSAETPNAAKRMPREAPTPNAEANTARSANTQRRIRIAIATGAPINRSHPGMP
jgi:hypothetical protein